MPHALRLQYLVNTSRLAVQQPKIHVINDDWTLYLSMDMT